MGVPEPLRYSPFRMYRRKSLYTGLYGTNYSGPTRPHGDTTDSAGVPIQSRPNPSHRTYTSSFFDEYAPHPGRMAMSSKDYQPYDGPATPHIPRPSQPPALEPERANAFEPEVKYEDCLMDEDFFQAQMDLLREQFGEVAVMQWDNSELASKIMQASAEEETSEFDNDLRAQTLDIQMAAEQMKTEPLTAAELTPEDVAQKFIDVTGALRHLQEVFPEDHPDIMNLRTALHDILDDPEAMSKLESLAGEVGPSKLGTGNPYVIDPFEEAEQLFEQQMQSLESAFNEPIFEPAEPHAPDMFGEQPEMMFEQLPEEIFPGAESLEQIVEHEDSFGTLAPEFMEQDMMPGVMPEPDGYNAGLIAEEINQAIDEVSQPWIEEMEPEPSQVEEHDQYMMGHDILEQMQYMANPFMTPEAYGQMRPEPTEPMSGPFGLGPMLDAGPGGPP